jgi:8-oxo-dGTP pyrophosphatase MutT (NUDIX family)
MASEKTKESEYKILEWERVDSELVADCRILRIKRDISLDPRSRTAHDFFVIEAPNWINVIPFTTDGRVILIEQYRHGTGEITLEIPGGLVDQHESPAAAAARELLEETGYECDSLELLGRTRPNPAIQNNWQHTYVARDCRWIGDPKPDEVEDIGVRLVSLDDVRRMIASGVINHALVVVAFYYLFASTGSQFASPVNQTVGP